MPPKPAEPRTPVPTLDEERALWASGRTIVAGVDEVGLGALAGPVVAAAVVLPPEGRPGWLAELRDSKLLSPSRRERLATAILAEADCGVGFAAAAVIDSINVRRASHLAMERAVALLPVAPSFALVDGAAVPALGCAARAIVNGDALVCSIAAASIVAKVARDRLMTALDAVYPGYGFAAHKGYAARSHLQAIYDLGVTPIHRRSFASVRSRLNGDGHLERLLATAPANRAGR